jgi:CelD/BcsL family acetyltransferase involved in cellulose biosynthesis
MIRLEVIRGSDAFERYTPEWHELVEASPYATPFQTPEWHQIWADTYRPRHDFAMLEMREGRDLVGLVPLVQSVSPWRSYRSAAAGPSDYLGPILRDSSDALLDATLEGYRHVTEKRLLDLHQIPSDHPIASRLGDYDQIEQARCLLLKLPPTFDAYVQTLSKSLRYDVRRIDGKALQSKNATVEWVNPDNVDAFATTFFELHKARWKSRGLPGAFFGKGERFQRTWMHTAVKQGWLSMNQLIADGRPVGCVYAMRFGMTCYFYQAGMAPEASSLSPGTILVAKMIERAIQEGCTTFDFMRGDEPYKRRWKPTHERTNQRILMSPNRVLAMAGKQWNELAWRVELKVRDRVEGKSLKSKPVAANVTKPENSQSE